MSLACCGVHVNRGDKCVLQDLSYNFEAGKLIGLIGPNGSGKSTLLRALYGFLEPDQGRVELAGKDLATWSPSELAAQLGVCPQEPEPTLDFEVRQILALRFGGDVRKTEESLAELKFLGISDLSGKRLSELSGGERQRVRLALALSGNAPWLLLDEPANHLDLATGWALFQHLVRCTEAGTGVVIALHDLHTALLHCEELVVLKNGRLCSQGGPLEVLSEKTLREVFGLRGKIVEVGGRHQLQLDGVVSDHE